MTLSEVTLRNRYLYWIGFTATDEIERHFGNKPFVSALKKTSIYFYYFLRHIFAKPPFLFKSFSLQYRPKKATKLCIFFLNSELMKIFCLRPLFVISCLAKGTHYTRWEQLTYRIKHTWGERNGLGFSKVVSSSPRPKRRSDGRYSMCSLNIASNSSIEFIISKCNMLIIR